MLTLRMVFLGPLLLFSSAVLSEDSLVVAAKKAEAALYCSALAPTGIEQQRLLNVAVREGRKFLSTIDPLHPVMPKSVYAKLDTTLWTNVVYSEYSNSQSIDFALGAAAAYVTRNVQEEVEQKSVHFSKPENEISLEEFKVRNCELLR